MMGCSITGSIEGEVIVDGESIGLISGHAYSIQEVFEIDDENGRKVRLLRIRNPWGKGNPVEWNGAWSDGSEELFDHLDAINKKILEINDEGEAELIKMDNTEDGTFLMCYEDYLTYWNRMSICYDFTSDYTGIRYDTSWEESNAGGTPYNNTQDQLEAWLTNEQYMIDIDRKDGKKTHVFISLGQNDGRLISSGDNLYPFPQYTNPVILIVMRMEPSERKVTRFDGSRIVKMSSIKEYREISLNLELPNGKYAIIPSTQNMG